MTAEPGKNYIEAWLPGVGGTQFYTRTYPATFPKAIVLFVHGFAEHVGRYEHAHVKYPTRGITLFAFDLRGYGRTALDHEKKSKDSAYGKTSWHMQMQDIEWFGRYLEKENPGVPLFLMGHSAVRYIRGFMCIEELIEVVTFVGPGGRSGPCILHTPFRTSVAGGDQALPRSYMFKSLFAFDKSQASNRPLGWLEACLASSVSTHSCRRRG